ncbi:MAG: hypothetical protein IKB34_01210 [Clostridia bacterium]|nr:hypothetical protein [Clostridia bacterium]
MELNIEAIMDDIRAEIKEKGYTADMLSFSDVMGISTDGSEEYNSKEFEATLNTANEICIVPFDPPMSGNPIALFIKKVIRKLIRFYIRPTVEQQNDFNAQTVRCLNMVGRIADDIYSRPSTNELEQRIRLLEFKLETATKENSELRSRLDKLESVVAERATEE